MSPSSPRRPPTPPSLTSLTRLLVVVGRRVREERVKRRWTLTELAEKAALSRSTVQAIEAGRAGSLDAYVRLATAFRLALEADFADPRRQRSQNQLRPLDPVHSAMGELEAAHIRHFGFPVGIDEPYQHFQFAGRADVVAWQADRRAFLHLENRTGFPNFQDASGAYNAKRSYLAGELGSRIGISDWASETHVIVALWTTDVAHSLRLRPASVRSICPDPPDAFAAWWSGDPPLVGVTSTFVALDPAASGRQRLFMGFDEFLSTRPRHRNYAQAVAALLALGR